MSSFARWFWVRGLIAVFVLSVTHGCVHIERDVRRPVVRREVVGLGVNRTTAEALAAVSRNPEILGTGLFVLPAPDLGALEYSVRMVPHLTYDEVVQRGQTCPAFKFVPESQFNGCIMRPRDLLDSAKGCGGPCEGGGGRLELLELIRQVDAPSAIGRFSAGLVFATSCIPPCECSGGICREPRVRDVRDFLELCRGIEPQVLELDTDPRD